MLTHRHLDAPFAQMCGVRCLSMKRIVILDLAATLILPASLICVGGHIMYVTFWTGEPPSLLMLVVRGIVADACGSSSSRRGRAGKRDKRVFRRARLRSTRAG